MARRKTAASSVLPCFSGVLSSAAAAAAPMAVVFEELE